MTGTSMDDFAESIAVDSTGNIYVSGFTSGSFLDMLMVGEKIDY